jgi:hypothetical protein
VPELYFERDFAEAGGLMSYGPNIPTFYRQPGNLSAAFSAAKSPAFCQ